MQIAVLLAAMTVIASTFDIQAQQPPQTKPPAQEPQQAKPPQRRAPARTATFAILVMDPTGAEIPNVAVTVEGPTPRTTRTEGGRIALENLRPGEYLIRFEKEGFLTLERQVIARAGKPIEVTVALKPAPEPPEPPQPPPAEESKAPSTAKPAAFDVPGVIEREFIGRAPLKTTPLVCGADANATLIQLNDPVGDHTHDESDEFIYVVAGEGAANVGGAAHKLRAGVLLFVPRGTTHRFSQSGRNPLIVLSMKAGGNCG